MSNLYVCAHQNAQGYKVKLRNVAHLFTPWFMWVFAFRGSLEILWSGPKKIKNYPSQMRLGSVVV